MPKVLVTGMSGTGKSAALQAPGERGHRVVDTDTGEWSHWVTSPDGSPDWIWHEDAIAALLATHQHGHLFVAGCKTNQGKFYAQFDHIALLSAPADVLLARIAARTTSCLVVISGKWRSFHGTLSEYRKERKRTP